MVVLQRGKPARPEFEFCRIPGYTPTGVAMVRTASTPRAVATCDVHHGRWDSCSRCITFCARLSATIAAIEQAKQAEGGGQQRSALCHLLCSCGWSGETVYAAQV